jgi:hypothetical protein
MCFWGGAERLLEEYRYTRTFQRNCKGVCLGEESLKDIFSTDVEKIVVYQITLKITFICLICVKGMSIICPSRVTIYQLGTFCCLRI